MNGDSGTYWAATVTVDNGTVDYCTTRDKQVDGEQIYYKVSCKSVSLEESESLEETEPAPAEGFGLMSLTESEPESLPEITNESSGTMVQHRMKKSEADCHPITGTYTEPGYVQCEYGLALISEVPDGTVFNQKAMGKTEIYDGGTFTLLPDGRYEYNYDGSFLGKFSESENININYDNGVWVYDLAQVVVQDGELVYCENKLRVSQFEPRVIEGECVPLFSEELATDPSDEHESSLLQETEPFITDSNPEFIEDVIQTLLETYDAGLLEGLDLDTFDALAAGLLKDYETALLDVSDESQ